MKSKRKYVRSGDLDLFQGQSVVEKEEPLMWSTFWPRQPHCLVLLLFTSTDRCCLMNDDVSECRPNCFVYLSPIRKRNSGKSTAMHCKVAASWPETERLVTTTPQKSDVTSGRLPLSTSAQTTQLTHHGTTLFQSSTT